MGIIEQKQEYRCAKITFVDCITELSMVVVTCSVIEEQPVRKLCKLLSVHSNGLRISKNSTR